VPGGEFGDAPPGVPLVDPAADAGAVTLRWAERRN